MSLAKRNHYNPCFWTANWNTDYFLASRAGKADSLRAREQLVHVLNVKSAKIYEANVDSVHYEKNLGVAEMTAEDMRDFCKRHHPDCYQAFCEEIEKDPTTLYLDFESILTGIENSEAYDALRKVIRTHRIHVPHDKAMLATFLVIHWHRSHAVMNSFLELTAELGQKKFEHFIMLKWQLSNHGSLYRQAMTLVPYRWHLYETDRDAFPLNDSPVLIGSDKVFIALSPRLLLEIDRSKIEGDSCITWSNYIRPDKLNEFRTRTLANTYREIIFSSARVLEEWRSTPEFSSRHELLKKSNQYNEIVSVQGKRELWNINALANRLS